MNTPSTRFSKTGPASSAADLRDYNLPISSNGRSVIQYEQTPTLPVPASLLAKHRLVGAPGRGDLWDRFCTLRSRVVQTMAQNGWRTIGVTSACRGEGKTWTAVNLSIAISRLVGNTALLVDANLRRPAVHRYFNMRTDTGLAGHLREEFPVEQMLVHPTVGNLTVLPAGDSMAEYSDYFSSERMYELVQDVKQRYDNRTVIFDLPAIEDGDGVLAMLPHLDTLLLVVEDGVTRSDVLERSVEALGTMPILGTVLNKVQYEDD